MRATKAVVAVVDIMAAVVEATTLVAVVVQALSEI